MPTLDTPIRLHPENSHYLLFRGKPTILLGSTEHYGAVLNLDFDYVPYLNELQARGLNLTRTFSGSYREVPGSFGIQHNTLAPAPGRYICPWPRSSAPGASDGGNKFDLSKWDPAYFSRLKDFITEAGRRGIVVELVLFCTLYDDRLWDANPLNPRNNINGVGHVKREQVFALRDQAVTTAQDALVRKLLRELKGFDNLYYEVCNEPYFGGVTDDWQNHIIGTILESEAAFPSRHLIAQNIANGYKQVFTPNGAVSIFNFHYAWPPVAVGMNYQLDRPIAFDETGFKGSSDRVYRMNAWEFILAGGSVFDNLDYSFTTAHPDGTAHQSAPGGGSPALRAQYHILRDFIEGFDFLRMAPAHRLVRGGATPGPEAHYVWNNERPADISIKEFPPAPRAWVLAQEGRAYAIYIAEGSQVDLLFCLPAGRYRSEWLDTKSGHVEKPETFHHTGGDKRLASPPYSDDIALRISRA
jgi:hypothetical protein